MQNLFNKFDIFFDTEEKKDNACCLKKLINSLGDKLKGVKHRPITIAVQNILKMYRSAKKDASYGSVIRVLDNDFDHEFIPSGWCRERSDKEYNLMRDFERLVELLSSIVDEPRRPEYEVEVRIEVPRPKKLRKVTVYDKITILERWVKIGYQMYRRQFDGFSGDEYIVVDGDVYYIKCNRYGQEYLA